MAVRPLIIPANDAIMGKRLNDNRVNNTQKYTWLFNIRFTSDTCIYNFFTLINDIIPENPAQIEPIFSLNALKPQAFRASENTFKLGTEFEYCP